MKKSQVIKRIQHGEDSQTQFKENFTNSEQAVPFGQINACGGSPALVKVQPSLLEK